MDYTLKVINVASKAEKTNVECNPMEAWKVRYWKNNIITGGDQGKIFVYETENGNLLNDYRFSDSYISTIAVSGKNEVVFGNSKGELGYFTEQSVQLVPTKHKKYIRAMTFLSDNNKLVMCSDDLTITVMDIQSGKTINTFTGHTNLVNSVDAHPTDPVFITGSNDRTIKVWDLRQSGAVDTPQNTSNSPIWAVKFANRGKEVLVGSEIGMLSLLTA